MRTIIAGSRDCGLLSHVSAAMEARKRGLRVYVYNYSGDDDSVTHTF